MISPWISSHYSRRMRANEVLNASRHSCQLCDFPPLSKTTVQRNVTYVSYLILDNRGGERRIPDACVVRASGDVIDALCPLTVFQSASSNTYVLYAEHLQTGSRSQGCCGVCRSSCDVRTRETEARSSNTRIPNWIRISIAMVTECVYTSSRTARGELRALNPRHDGQRGVCERRR